MLDLSKHREFFSLVKRCRELGLWHFDTVRLREILLEKAPMTFEEKTALELAKE